MFKSYDDKSYEKWLISHSYYDCISPMKRIDYSYKSFILSLGFCKEISRIDYELYLATYAYDIDFKSGLVLDPKASFNALGDLINKYGVCAIHESRRINNAKYHRESRLKARVGEIIKSSRSYFLTFTFRNEFVYAPSKNYLPPKKMRDLVQRFLKKYTTNYVANFDYGEKNGRIHLHAIVSAPFINPNLWIYGNLDYEVVYTPNDSTKLSLYIDKLTLHGIKKTCKRVALIYCRTPNTSHNFTDCNKLFNLSL